MTSVPATKPLSAVTRVSAGGRVVIPAEMRAALNLQTGDRIIITCDGGELRVISVVESVRRVQEDVRQRFGSNLGIVDEFLRERRAEAARE